jgi:hypothetical protein
LNRLTQGNSRRFYRYDLPIKLFVKANALHSSMEIYTSQIDYVNDAIFVQIESSRKEIKHQLNLIEEHAQILKDIVKEFFQRFDLIMEWLQQMDQGLDPKKRSRYWQDRDFLNSEFESLQLLESHAPKTFALLQKLELQFITYSTLIQQCIDQSNELTLVIPDDKHCFAFHYQIDQMFKNSGIQIEQSNLLAMIHELEKLLGIGFSTFINMSIDQTKEDEPHYWPMMPVNISACGLAIQDTRKLPLFEFVTVKLQLNDQQQSIVSLKCKVIRKQFKKSLGINLSAVNYYFPDAHMQQQIASYLGRHEVQNAMRKETQYAGH